MAVREIKTTLALDGEKQFKAGMDDAYRAMKVLGSEMKLNTASFGKNAESMEGLTGKSKTLSAMQEQQAKIVQALAKAVEDSAKAYGDSDKRTDAYRVKLNNAKASLANIENQLDSTNREIDQFGQETEQAEKKTHNWRGALEKVGGALKSGIVTGAKATGVAMAAIGTASVAAVKGIFDLTTGAGQLADELLTTSAQTGVSTTALQEWGYAARFIDVEVETMTGSMAKMIRQLATAKEGTGASAEAFAALGVNITDSSGQLLASQDIFFASIDALGKVANETERDALAMQIFGKSAQELNPLIKAGSDELMRLGAEAQAAGLVMDETALGSLGGFDDTMQRLQATLQGTANNVAQIFLPALQSVATGAQQVMTTISSSLRDGFQPEDIATIGQAISQKLSEGMQRLTQYLPQIISTMSDVLSKLIAFAVDYLPTLLPQLMTAAVALLTGALQAIKDNIKQIAETVKVLIKSFVQFIVGNLPMIIDVAIEIIFALIDGLISAIPDLVAAIPKILDAIWNALVKAVPKMLEVGVELVKGLWQGIQSAAGWIWEKISGWIGGIWKDIKGFFGIKSPSSLMAETVGKPMVQGMALGITRNAGLIDKAMASLVPSAVHSNVSMDVTRRFTDVTSSRAQGSGSLAATIVAGFRSALAEHNEQVIVLNDREFGRAVRAVVV
jgi:phage-related protein